MSPSSRTPIKEIADGAQVQGLYLVKEMSRGETKTGKPYLSLVLMDATGEISAKVWERADELAELCPAGAVVVVSGQSQSYKGLLQLRLDRLRRAEAAEIDPALLMPSTAASIPTMAKELLRCAGSVENPFLKALLLSLFEDPTIIQAFKEAPGAKLMHHACRGGLLEHTLAVTRLAESVCALYPGLDRPLLLTGALLHDLGKIREFDYSSFPFDYTDQGRLVGHMVLGVEMVQERINRIEGFPAELAALLKHLILSHHGRHEFGSPSLPMTREAFVLNFLDDLDAKINYLDRLAGQARNDGYQWTDFQRNLERFLFVKGHRDETPATESQPIEQEASPENSRRQPSLFS